MNTVESVWSPELLEALAEFHPRAEERGSVYGVLERLFRDKPTPDLLEALRSDAFASGIGQALGQTVEESLRGLPAPNPAVMQDFEEDFSALLKAPVGRFLKPWESVHRDKRVVDGVEKEGLLSGPSTRDVKYFYKVVGAELDTHLPELPDHIATELGFMAFLAKREGESWVAGSKEEAASDLSLSIQFFDDHVRSWMPGLLEKMSLVAMTDLYKTVSLLTRRFLEEEQSFLSPARRILGRGEGV